MIEQRLVEDIAFCCGISRLLYFGNSPAQALEFFLRKGIDVRASISDKEEFTECNSYFPRRVYEGSLPNIMAFTGDAWRPETIICTALIDHAPGETVLSSLRNFWLISRRNVILHVEQTNIDGELRDRAWWEKCSFRAGFRIHPRSYHVLPYEARESESNYITIFLEKIPESAYATYPMKILEENRILHMDMLRETGRRGDAHCIRYHMASQYIRPGDTVLDVACGLGYGSHILYHNSSARKVLGVDLSEEGVAYATANYGLGNDVQFRVGDAQRLDFLPDNSIDFITGFETIEHVPCPEEYLLELNRVLRPSGRLMICAPNDWTDETGRDPNPHHLHVYTWNRLFKECEDLFLLEKGFAQTAGGAMKLHHSPRRWEEVALQPILDRESEWAVLLCMADPTKGKDIPYAETVWRIPSDPKFNVSAFARDYENPWLVRGMVAIGMRNESLENLRYMRSRVIEIAPPDSADYGAALCGKAYDILASDVIPADVYKSISESILRYAAIKSPTPHQLRWQVSLLFVGAELARKRGDFEGAAAFYSRCSEIDVQEYSPLLGNRVLDSLYWLAIICLNNGDIDRARIHLVRSVKECKRLLSNDWLNICGDMEEPLPFGLAESAQLLDKASRAAYMLSALKGGEDRSHLIATESMGYYERLLAWKDMSLDSQKRNIDELTREVARLDSRAHALVSEFTGRENHGQELAREVRRLDARAQELAKEVAERDGHAQELALEVRRLDANAQALAVELREKEKYAQDLSIKVEYWENLTLWRYLKKKVMKK